MLAPSGARALVAAAIATWSKSASPGKAQFSRRTPYPTTAVTRLTGPGGVVSGVAGAAIAHERVAGVGSAFPAASIARTANVCAPAASPPYVFGALQASKAAPSRAHSKREPASVAAKTKVAVVLEPSAGADEIVVSGA